jgi:hypothetical protein
VAGHIHAGISVSGLGLHFTGRFASHGSENARCLPKGGLHREARFHANCKPCPAVCKAHFGDLRKSGPWAVWDPELNQLTRY